MDLKENQEKFFTYDRVHPWETVRLSFVETLRNGGMILSPLYLIDGRRV